VGEGFRAYMRSVRIVHGAPRAEHILMTDDVCFISPAEAGVVCREWDEAWMLASIITKWESWSRKWPCEYVEPPFEVTELHLMLLQAYWSPDHVVYSLIGLKGIDAQKLQELVIDELSHAHIPGLVG